MASVKTEKTKDESVNQTEKSVYLGRKKLRRRSRRIISLIGFSKGFAILCFQAAP